MIVKNKIKQGKIYSHINTYMYTYIFMMHRERLLSFIYIHTYTRLTLVKDGRRNQEGVTDLASTMVARSLTVCGIDRQKKQGEKQVSYNKVADDQCTTLYCIG